MQVESGQLRLPGFDDEPKPNSPRQQAIETPSELYARVFRHLRPRTALPEISFDYAKFANANSFIRMAAGKLEIRITDALQAAPPAVHEALAFILLCKLFRKPIPAEHRHRYKVYLNRKDVRQSLQTLRQVRGRKHVSGPQGAVFNLDEVFDAMNAQYFNSLMAKPALGWSRGISRSTLGHFDPAHNAIIMSRIFDKPGVPRLALEFVMYHEMLHLKFPVDAKGARRRIHPPEFRAAEKQFAQYKEAKALLEKLCGEAFRNESW